MEDLDIFFGFKKMNNLVSKLTAVPKKDTKDNMPRIRVGKANAIHQADILYLPNDGGYKYLLVVVDTATRKLDAEPLLSHSSSAVLKAILKIYERGTLKLPVILQTDDGNEFKGSFYKLKKKGVDIRHGRPNRHRQIAMAEGMNYLISKGL